MIIDCHYHYFKEEFNLPDKLIAMDRAGIEKTALIAAVCSPFKAEPKTIPMRFMRILMGKRSFLPLLERLLCTFKGGGIDILGQQVPIYDLPDNDSVFETAMQAPDRLSAYITINPNCQSETVLQKEIERLSGYACFCGVKAHPFYHRYQSDQLDFMCGLLEPLHKPLLIHMNFGDWPHILRLADKHPRVNFILAHCAFPYFDLIWPELKKRPNIYVDISSGCYVDAKMARRVVDALGTDHVLYGSDGPYGTPEDDGTFDMRQEYTFATRLLTEEELKWVSSRNFERLLTGE